MAGPSMGRRKRSSSTNYFADMADAEPDGHLEFLPHSAVETCIS
jgi:hypothetical protein